MNLKKKKQKEGDVLQPAPLEKSSSETEPLLFRRNTGRQDRKKRENGFVGQRDGFTPDPAWDEAILLPRATEPP